jgi:hypothetical protein
MEAPQELTTLAQDLVIDQANAFNWQIDDVDAVQMNASLMDEAMERSAYHLAEQIDGYCFRTLAGAITPSNTIGTPGAPITITESNVYDVVVQMRTILAKNNVPTDNRQVAIPPEMVAMLLRDKRFTGTGGTFAEGTLLSGMIAQGLGFKVFEVNTLPENDGVYEVLANHNVSATLANQIAKVEAARMEKRFADLVKGLSVYGAKVTIPKAATKAYVRFA